MDLTEARAVINQADEEIIRAFAKRMEAVVSVAEYKKAHGLPILDAAREAVVLDRVEKVAGAELGAETRRLYEAIMAVSRDYQARLLGIDGESGT